MMKKTIQLLALGVFANTVVFGQSVEDGIKAYYNGNYASAINILEKQSSDPNGAYWLAKSLFEIQKNDKANEVLLKALAANGSNFLLLAAKGQSSLLQNKQADARQSFEAAIAAAGKKEEDQAQALNAVGNAVTEVYNNIDKVGDIKYAVEKLEAAKVAIMGVKEKKRDMRLLADINTNLGEASLKANPGEGSRAFTLYQDALSAYPSFARAEYNKAKIFKSQRNLEMYLEALQKTTSINGDYLPALNDLYEYNAFTVKSMDAAKPYGEKIVSILPPSPNNEYFRAVALYINKQYPEAIKIGKDIISKAGDQTIPEAYKLVAYSLIENKDTAAAIPFVDNYFKAQTKDKILPLDYALKATSLSTTSGKETEIVKTYMDAANADTSAIGKVEVLEQGAKMFADAGKNALAGDLYAKILEVKPAAKITINDYFYAGYSGFYKSGQYRKAWKVFDAARTKFPKWNYGYRFAYESSRQFDTTNTENIMVPDADKYIAYLQSPDDSSDLTSKRGEIFKTSLNVAIFFANVKKDNTNAVKYLQTAYTNADDATAKEQVAGYIKAMGGTVSGGPSSGTSSNASATKAKGGK